MQVTTTPTTATATTEAPNNNMNFMRSRVSFGNILGPRCVTEVWSLRGLCNKLQEVKAEPPAKTSPTLGFKIPGYRPSEFDKKMLLWSGRYNTTDQIPELVSFEMLNTARNRVRVKACYIMMIATIGGCLLMVVLGKRAAARNESLTGQNMERKAKWREEQREQEANISLPDKAQ
ncbi:protein FAM162B [Stigmatopora nigra]